MDAAEKAQICRRAAWRMEVHKFMCNAIGEASGGLVGLSKEIVRDLARHLGEPPFRGRPSTTLPEFWTKPGRAARVELLSLAAEYYEAVAEGRARP